MERMLSSSDLILLQKLKKNQLNQSIDIISKYPHLNHEFLTLLVTSHSSGAHQNEINLTWRHLLELLQQRISLNDTSRIIPLPHAITFTCSNYHHSCSDSIQHCIQLMSELNCFRLQSSMDVLVNQLLTSMDTFDRNVLHELNQVVYLQLLPAASNKKKVFKDVLEKLLPRWIKFLSSLDNRNDRSRFSEQFKSILTTLIFHQDHLLELVSALSSHKGAVDEKETETRGQSYTSKLWSYLSSELSHPNLDMYHTLPIWCDSLLDALKLASAMKGQTSTLISFVTFLLDILELVLLKQQNGRLQEACLHALSGILVTIYQRKLYTPSRDEVSVKLSMLFQRILKLALSRATTEPIPSFETISAVVDLDPAPVMGDFDSLCKIILSQESTTEVTSVFMEKMLCVFTKANRLSDYLESLLSCVESLPSENTASGFTLLHSLRLRSALSEQASTIVGLQGLLCMESLLARLRKAIYVPQQECGDEKTGQKRKSQSDMIQDEISFEYVSSIVSLFDACMCGLNLSHKQQISLSQTFLSSILSSFLDADVPRKKKKQGKYVSLLGAILKIWFTFVRVVPFFASQTVPIEQLIKVKSSLATVSSEELTHLVQEVESVLHDVMVAYLGSTPPSRLNELATDTEHPTTVLLTMIAKLPWDNKWSKWTSYQQATYSSILAFLPEIINVFTDSYQLLEKITEMFLEIWENDGYDNIVVKRVLENPCFFELNVLKSRLETHYLSRLRKATKKLLSKSSELETCKMILRVLDQQNEPEVQQLFGALERETVSLRVLSFEEKYLNRVCRLIQLLFLVPIEVFSRKFLACLANFLYGMDYMLLNHSQGHKLASTARYLSHVLLFSLPEKPIQLLDGRALVYYAQSLTGLVKDEENTLNQRMISTTTLILQFLLRRLLQIGNSKIGKQSNDTGIDYWNKYVLTLTVSFVEGNTVVTEIILSSIVDHLSKLAKDTSADTSNRILEFVDEYSVTEVVDAVEKQIRNVSGSQKKENASSWRLLGFLMEIYEHISSSSEKMTGLFQYFGNVKEDPQTEMGLCFVLTWSHLLDSTLKPSAKTVLERTCAFSFENGGELSPSLLKAFESFVTNVDELSYNELVQMIQSFKNAGDISKFHLQVLDVLLKTRNKYAGRALIGESIPQMIHSVNKIIRGATSSDSIVSGLSFLTSIVSDKSLRISIGSCTFILSSIVTLSERTSPLSDPSDSAYQSIFKAVYSLLHSLQQYRRQQILQLAPHYFSCLMQLLDCFRIRSADTDLLVAHQKQKREGIDKVRHFRFMEEGCPFNTEMGHLLARVLVATCQKPVQDHGSAPSTDTSAPLIQENDVTTQYDILVKPFSKHAPHALTHIVGIQCSARPLASHAKSAFMQAVYALLDVCDQYGQAKVLASFGAPGDNNSLSNAARFIFKGLVEEWDKFHRFKGSA